MLKLNPIPVLIALSMAVPFCFADIAFAAKKPAHVTYERAWALCKEFVDVLPRDAQSQRYSRGAACMHKYGYRL
jgi:hypothetical protein